MRSRCKRGLPPLTSRLQGEAHERGHCRPPGEPACAAAGGQQLARAGQECVDPDGLQRVPPGRPEQTGQQRGHGRACFTGPQPLRNEHWAHTPRETAKTSRMMQQAGMQGDTLAPSTAPLSPSLRKTGAPRGVQGPRPHKSTAETRQEQPLALGACRPASAVGATH